MLAYPVVTPTLSTISVLQTFRFDISLQILFRNTARTVHSNKNIISHSRISIPMNTIKCELCGASELTKRDGMFVCDYCGTKYSLEEARKMMVEGTVEVTGTVRIDNSDQTRGLMQIACDAY